MPGAQVKQKPHSTSLFLSCREMAEAELILADRGHTVHKALMQAPIDRSPPHSHCRLRECGCTAQTQQTHTNITLFTTTTQPAAGELMAFKVPRGCRHRKVLSSFTFKQDYDDSGTIRKVEVTWG